MDQAELEFLKALSLINEIEAEPVEYRLHYNNAGEIYMCSMQSHPDNQQYLVVSKEQYNNYFRYSVVNNQLKLIDRSPTYRVQLKSGTTDYAVVQNHAGLLLESGETFKHIEYYDRVN